MLTNSSIQSGSSWMRITMKLINTLPHCVVIIFLKSFLSVIDEVTMFLFLWCLTMSVSLSLLSVCLCVSVSIFISPQFPQFSCPCLDVSLCLPFVFLCRFPWCASELERAKMFIHRSNQKHVGNGQEENSSTPSVPGFLSFSISCKVNGDWWDVN